MNSSKNDMAKSVEEIEGVGDDFLISTSILTFLFTGLYAFFRMTILKPTPPCNDSINSIIIDVSTCAPLSTLLAAVIGVTMIFGSVKSLKKKLVSQENEIEKLLQRIKILENRSFNNVKPKSNNLKSEKYDTSTRKKSEVIDTRTAS